MARLISEIIEEEVIDKMDLSLIVTDFEPATGSPLTQRVKFCSNRWLKLFSCVVIDGNEIAATVEDDGYVTLAIGATVPAVNFNTVITLKKPYYFVGTLLNTKLEWAKFSTSEKKKLPFIWLVKPTSETFNDAQAGIERTSDVEAWFVHWSDWSKLNAYREEEAVKPLMALLDAFIKAIVDNPLFDEYDNYVIKDFPKFGTETPNGSANTVFDSTLSAVKLNLSLLIFAHDCANC